MTVQHPEDEKVTAEWEKQKSYRIGNVGSGARVAQGEHITWTEGFAGNAEAEELKRQFADLLARIDKATDLDEDERALAKDKTEAVADGLANAMLGPDRLRRALRDARGFLTSSASWIWDGLNQILTSEAAQQMITSITDSGTKAAIQSLARGS
jgi:hypothetical protein